MTSPTHTEGELQVSKLATEPYLLDRVIGVVHALGVVGEDRAVKLIYLAMTTRLFDQPVSVIVKGLSSAGKSYVTRQILKLFPKSAYRELTAMSEKALIYSKEPLRHRMLVIYEAAGLQGEFGSYLMRSLLSEGRIHYETVDRKNGGELCGRTIDREGPTGVILTTTAIKIHPENETRLLSVPINDSPEQTRNVMRQVGLEALSDVAVPEIPDDDELGTWRALQASLETEEHRVAVPFALVLAEVIPTVAVRLRRDFPLILNLIRAHALLHQANRDRDQNGLLATLADYEVVRELVEDLVSEGLEASVPASVRETVAAVDAIIHEKGSCTGYRGLGETLELDKSAVSRRVQKARDLGYLRNTQEKSGLPAILVLGEPLPKDRQILPSVTELAALMDRCSVAADLEGREGTNENVEAFEL